MYPFDADTRYNLAYFFEYEFDGQANRDPWSLPIHEAIELWKLTHASSHLEVVFRSPEVMIVRDTRPNRAHPEYRFPNLCKTFSTIWSARA